MKKEIIDHKPHSLQSVERRRFIETTAKFGFTAAVVSTASGLIFSCEGTAAVAKDEKESEKKAKFTMFIATAYRLGASRSYPIMQTDFKENIQNFSDREIHVKLVPAGQLGTGGALAQKVQSGTIQAAQHSLSNFATYAPVVDLINVPYWCGENQKFINLVTSDRWKNMVHPQIEARGFKTLWYVCIDPRVVALRKGKEGPIKTPDQLEGIKFRVPGSKTLQKFYRLLGANPTPVAWGETASAIQQGVADALDPSVEALNIFGFKDVLSHVTFISAVPDSQVFSCNLKWFNGLPQHLKDAVMQASDVTSRQNLAKVPAARAFAMAELKAAGVNFYSPNGDEMKQWVAKAGHQREEWNALKIELAGSIERFDILHKTTEEQGSYYVDDV